MRAQVDFHCWILVFTPLLLEPWTRVNSLLLCLCLCLVPCSEGGVSLYQGAIHKLFLDDLLPCFVLIDLLN